MFALHLYGMQSLTCILTPFGILNAGSSGGYKHYEEDIESLQVLRVLEEKSVLTKILILMCEQCTY